MACIKCGKNTKDSEVFCPECLEVMEKYPVKAEIHIQLPNRPGEYYKPAKKRRPPTVEEQVSGLKKKVRWLTAVIILLIVTLGFSVYLLTRKEEAPKEVEWGTNYSTEESTD